jgi:phosphatidylserine decarboxylase
MLSYRYPLIAREGWLWIAVFALPALIVSLRYGAEAAWPLWLPALLLAIVFRDPKRKVPAAPLGIVSPVDGRVVKAAPVYDGYLKRDAVCLSVEMGWFNIWSVRSPMEGRLMEQWLAVPRKIGAHAQETYVNGKTYAQWIQSDERDDVVMVVDSTALARRPRCYAQSGQRIGQGQRCGFIRFGTRVDILVPAGARIQALVGDKVVAGESIIATLVHKA